MSKSTWVLDPSHTLIEFSVKHMMIATVKGRFGQFEGVVEADLPDLSTADISVTITAASVDTRVADRDTHLRSADFFDVENYPVITFRSRRVEHVGGSEYRIIGDLTIKDVTREVVLDAEFAGTGRSPWGQEVAGFNAETVINRKDWRLNWNVALEAGGVVVAEKVKLSIEAEAIKQEAPAEEKAQA